MCLDPVVSGFLKVKLYIQGVFSIKELFFRYLKLEKFKRLFEATQNRLYETLKGNFIS